MSTHQQIETLFKLLKAHLKARKLSYRELGVRLKMSESNLKRIFASKSSSLHLLIKICESAEISFYDLVAAAAQAETPYLELSEEAEAFFCQHFDCFILYRRMGRSNPEAVLKRSGLSAEKQEYFLKQLQKLKLVRFENGKIILQKLIYLKTRENSELQKLIEKKWAPWFFNQILRNRENPKHFFQMFSTGVSEKHRLQLLDEFKYLRKKYHEIGLMDQRIGTKECESVGICIGMGPYRIGYFEDFENPDEQILAQK